MQSEIKEMPLKKLWDKFVEKYMKNTAEFITLTEFPDGEVKRYKITFSGIVQGVGFRYETWRLAQKLELTGFVENLADGRVYAEIQGSNNQILHLIECLKSIPRIHIENMKIEEIEIKNESDFIIRDSCIH